MSEPGAPTLDQLRVFLAVADAGSFAAAARALRRATSVISYSIANLEAQLGVGLFDRESTKRPQLTEAGRALLAEARTVALGVDRLRARAHSLTQGVEAEVSAVLDVMLPAERVVDALRAFHASFPTVSLKLRFEALGSVTRLVLDRTAVIGVRGPPDVEVDGLQRLGAASISSRSPRLIIRSRCAGPSRPGRRATTCRSS